MENNTNIISFETFKKIGTYEISNIKKDEPSCFNSIISIKKYKITIEEVEEPKEILAERIQKLWDICDNYHHWTAIENAAKSIEYKLIGSAGNNRPK
jgi:hypothetical protein